MKVKVGFIGAGGMATAHMDRLSKMPNVEIIAISDIIESKAKEKAQSYNAKPYTDFHLMIEKEEMDAIWVVIPPFAHSDEIKIAAEKGIHVFIEKPIAPTLESAREMEKTTEKYKIKTIVGYHWRQFEAIKRGKNIIENEGGPIGMVAGYWWGGIPGGPDHWWRRKEISGGQVVEQTTHIFDLSRHLAGEVDRVFAEFATILNADQPNFTVEDVSIVTLRFKSGAIGYVTSTSGAIPEGTYVGLKLLARNLHFQTEGKTARIWKRRESIELKSSNDPVWDEDILFIEAIQNDTKVEPTISEALKSLEISIAAVKSAEKAEIIKLPL